MIKFILRAVNKIQGLSATNGNFSLTRRLLTNINQSDDLLSAILKFRSVFYCIKLAYFFSQLCDVFDVVEKCFTKPQIEK